MISESTLAARIVLTDMLCTSLFSLCVVMRFPVRTGQSAQECTGVRNDGLGLKQRESVTD